MTDELKPCPFCGGDAMTCFDNERMVFRHSVECIVCGGRSWWYSTKEVAAAAWNARADRTCEMVELEDVSWDKYDGVADGARRCSSCGAVFIRYGNVLRPNFCPNCGAKVVAE